jgi:hypothetical protein
MDNLDSRIRALEASNRRQRYSITALAAIIVGGAFIAATRPAGDATFDTVTCKAWAVVDNSGKTRIDAYTLPNGSANVRWFDTNGKPRLAASTQASGSAGMTWYDKDFKTRMSADTMPDGSAGMRWIDNDNKVRISALTKANSTVNLPTTDLKPNP